MLLERIAVKESHEILVKKFVSGMDIYGLKSVTSQVLDIAVNPRVSKTSDKLALEITVEFSDKMLLSEFYALDYTLRFKGYTEISEIMSNPINSCPQIRKYSRIVLL